MYVISTTGTLRGLGARVTDPVAPSTSPFDPVAFGPVTFGPVREPTFTPTYTPPPAPAPVKPAAPVTAVAPIVPAVTATAPPAATTSDPRITAQVIDVGTKLEPPAPTRTREIAPPPPTGSGDGSAGSRVEHRPPPPEFIRPDGSDGPPLVMQTREIPPDPNATRGGGGWLSAHWPWLLGGVAVVGGAAFVITRKRKA
jgi:hypothetical protein